MIQRIQTVYLSLALLSMALMFAFRIAVFKSESVEWLFSVYGISPEHESAGEVLWMPPYVLNTLIIILLAVSIGLFKNRKVQMVIGRISYLLIMGYFVLLYWWTDSMAEILIPDVNPSYGAGIYFPIAAFTFVFLANRSIKKDEQLVKSLDRLR